MTTIKTAGARRRHVEALLKLERRKGYEEFEKRIKAYEENMSIINKRYEDQKIAHEKIMNEHREKMRILLKPSQDACAELIRDIQRAEFRPKAVVKPQPHPKRKIIIRCFLILIYASIAMIGWHLYNVLFK